VKPAFTTNGATYGSNSVYDSEGKLLFYIANFGNIYNKFNLLIGTLPTIYVSSTEISIIPNPNNSACFNKYFVVFTKEVPGGCPGGTCGSIQYVEIDMNGNSGLGQMITNTNPSLGTPGSVATPFAVSKLQNGKRFFYFVDNSSRLQMREVTSTGISNTVNILTALLSVNGFVAELELSNTGDKIAYASSNNNAGTIDILPLTPSTGLATGASPIVITANGGNNIRGLEFNNAADKLFYTIAGAGLYYTNLSTPTVKNTISTTYDNCMLEKNFNGSKIIAASTSNLVTIDAVTNVIGTTVPFSLPTSSASSNLILMPDQIDGENYDITGTTNVDVNTFTASLSATWLTTSNPFFALQQNSYLGTLTSFANVRVANSINIPNAISININKMTFEFQTNAELNVNGGGNLTLTGALLQGHPCGLMWRGISVNNNNVTNASNFTMINSGLNLPIIYDAIRGVEVNGANVTTSLTNALFDKNEKGVVLNSVNPSIVNITGSNFFSTLPLKDQTKGQVLTTSGTVRYGITGIEANTTGTFANKLKIGSATVGNNFKSGQFGVNAINTELVIQKNNFQTADAAAVNARSSTTVKQLDVFDNTFLNNSTDTWAVSGCNQDTKRNTFTNTKGFCMRWAYNGGSFIVGDITNNSDANTFEGYGWAAIAVSECANASTLIEIHRNIFKNAPWAGGVIISESTLTSASKTYNGYRVNNNTFTNVGRAVNVVNVKGENSTTNTNWNGDLDLNSTKYDIQNNNITFATNYDASAIAIKVENSWKNRALSNIITSDNSGNWQNNGINFLTCPNSLIKGNSVQAGIGINLGLDMLGSNVLCNTLKYCVKGIGPGWSRIRIAGTQHGEAGIRGRQNTFISNTYDIEMYYSYDTDYKWISPNTTNINYVPGGSYGTSIIYSDTEPSPCGGGGARMAGTDDSISTEASSNYETNIIPQNYNANVAAAQAQNKQFIDGIAAVKINNNAAITSNNLKALAKAQICLESKDYNGSKNHLKTLLSNTSLVEYNLATILDILTTCKEEERYEYTKTEEATILSIAASDSRIGGQGVHYARGIALASFNRLFEDPYLSNTASPSAKRSKLTTNTNVEQKQLIGLYPNPAKTNLTITTTNGQKTITVYNNMGVKVYSYLTDGTLTIDVSSWSSGVYLTEIYDTNTNKKETNTFIIE
jgi:hypothetical protein